MKTDVTELRHILRTVQYAALAYINIGFEVTADGEVLYNLPTQTLKERITQIFGAPYKASLIEFEEQTSYLKIYGFASDPKLAKKSRGEQFLFVNGRPFQHRYLTHVILSLYDAWTRNNQYPFYALFFDIDASKIDINVHPAKMEIKFQDERSVIQLAKSVVNRALHSHFQVPNIPIEQDSFLSGTSSKGFDSRFSFNSPGVSSNKKNRDFDQRIPSRINTNPVRGKGNEFAEKLYKPEGGASPSESFSDNFEKPSQPLMPEKTFWQLHNSYIITQTRNGFCMIDQYLAHKRIIFEKTLSHTQSALPSTQQLLFAQTLELSASDYTLLKRDASDYSTNGIFCSTFEW